MTYQPPASVGVADAGPADRRRLPPVRRDRHRGWGPGRRSRPAGVVAGAALLAVAVSRRLTLRTAGGWHSIVRMTGERETTSRVGGPDNVMWPIPTIARLAWS